MKKKLLTTVLTVGVVLSLVGCGAKETTSSESVAETTVAEGTTEYVEETTEVEEIATEEVAEETVVEATTEEVVEEQTTETTETVEETVVEETTEEVPKLPKVFTNDDPDTSTIIEEEYADGAYNYMWHENYLIAPYVSIFPGTDKFEECKAKDMYKPYATVTTSEGDAEVIMTMLEGEEFNFYVYVYTLGDSSIMLMGGNPEGMSTEELQYFANLIRFE